MSKEERDTIKADDGAPLTPSFRATQTGSSSMATSLRSFLSAENECDDSDSFVFTDQIHQRQDFRRLSMALIEFGVIDDDSDEEGKNDNDKTNLETTETTPLLNKSRTDIGEQDKSAKAEKKKEETRGRHNYRRKSKLRAYHRGQKEVFLEVLDRIDGIQSTTRKDKGFKEWKFAFGLINCLLVSYMFGSHPEHFWILYAIETSFWMSYKFRGMCRAKPLSQALYYLDFCWVMNVSGVAIIFVMLISNAYLNDNILPIEIRKNIFLACFGIFCGPVFFAAMTLPFVAFLFHDVNTMANLIIHLMPSMAMYNYRWHAAEISNAYPHIYSQLLSFTEELGKKNTQSPTQITLAVYFAWFIPYTIWFVLVGLKLPVVSKDKSDRPPKYDTVFHATWKGGMCELAGKLWKRPKEISRDCSERNDYELRDFFLYMLGHALGSCVVGIILIGDILCFRGGKMVHATLLWFTTILCAKRGADRYTYYVTSMYGYQLRKAFKEIELNQQQEIANLSDNGCHSDTIDEKDEDEISTD